MTSPPGEIRLIPVRFLDEVRRGDDLVEKLRLAMRHQKKSLQDGDVLVIKHKIVSKAEAAFAQLNRVRVTAKARSWAKRYGLDPRIVTLALRESKRIVRQKNGVLITETRHGLICANSGVDVSNVDGGRSAVLLPENPDRSAERLRSAIRKQFKVSVAVIISDSFGRPWREGLTEVAIGVAGMKPLCDYCGRRDPEGYKLHATVDAVADELASAAGLVCAKLNRTPVCIVRGFRYRKGRGSARQLIRPGNKDLFR
jgi:coenzyme F420-0:L-glutamate ligase/coenzyme F420-1:gamma-L-glutamate ligase